MYRELFEHAFDANIQQEFVLLDVVQPMMILLQSEGTYYFVYLLQDRRIKTKDGKRAHVYEIFVSETTIEDVLLFLKEKVTLGKLLKENKTYRIGKIANKIFPKKELVSMKEIQDRFPDGDFTLSPLIPNRIDIEEVKEILEKIPKKG